MFAERRISLGLGRLLVTGWVLLASGIAAEAGQVYLALGDSITFGVGSNDTATDISNGERGYVAVYADYLAGVYGTRPTVIDHAVSGETSMSFNGQGSGLDGPLAAARNLNYP